MKTKLKQAVQAITVAGMFILGLGMVQRAEAYKNPDTMTVYVTPIGLNYSVSIASSTLSTRAGYDFGQVTIGATTISTMAIVVTNDGTVGEYFTLAISNSAPDSWAAQNTLAAATFNKFFLLGEFVAHSNPQPQSASFDVNVDSVVATGVGYGNGNFGQSGATPPSGSNSKDLWLKLKMPDSVSVAREQTMTLSINAQSN